MSYIKKWPRTGPSGIAEKPLFTLAAFNSQSSGGTSLPGVPEVPNTGANGGQITCMITKYPRDPDRTEADFIKPRAKGKC